MALLLLDKTPASSVMALLVLLFVTCWKEDEIIGWGETGGEGKMG